MFLLFLCLISLISHFRIVPFLLISLICHFPIVFYWMSLICHFLIVFFYEGTEDERGLSAGAMALYIHAWHNKVIPSLKKNNYFVLFFQSWFKIVTKCPEWLFVFKWHSVTHWPRICREICIEGMYRDAKSAKNNIFGNIYIYICIHAFCTNR